VRGACASGGFGRYARGCFAAARFLHSSAHDALGGCSLFTFFYILHDALGGCSLFTFYFLLLVSLIGSKINLDCEDHKMVPISLKDKLYTSLESAHLDLHIHLTHYSLF